MEISSLLRSQARMFDPKEPVPPVRRTTFPDGDTDWVLSGRFGMSSTYLLTRLITFSLLHSALSSGLFEVPVIAMKRARAKVTTVGYS